MKKTRPQRKYTLTLLERIAIGANLCVGVVALAIIIYVLATTRQLNANAISFNKETQHTQGLEESSSIIIEQETEVESIQTEIVIENYYENLSGWCLEHESTETITLWKRTDSDGSLLIAFRSSENNDTIATFKYETIENEYYEEWTLCNSFFEEITVQDIVDYSFTAYHEVGGKNPENVQAQVCVMINRQNCFRRYHDTIREVIEYGYSCAKNVVYRRLKSDNVLEEIDLENCFRQAVLALSGELVQQVPADVVYAATTAIGDRIWKIIDNTVYSFL